MRSPSVRPHLLDSSGFRSAFRSEGLVNLVELDFEVASCESPNPKVLNCTQAAPRVTHLSGLREFG